jgi:hypothetical protein
MAVCSPARFLPDPGRHKLIIYPKMFTQSRREQLETVIHELGHIFGLRHFFANVREKAYPSVIFGKHQPFTIMNYGGQSTLTPDDKSDLRRLYDAVWSGSVNKINGTPIKLVSPFHTIAGRTESMVAVGEVHTVLQQPAQGAVAGAADYVSVHEHGDQPDK